MGPGGRDEPLAPEGRKKKLCVGELLLIVCQKKNSAKQVQHGLSVDDSGAHKNRTRVQGFGAYVASKYAGQRMSPKSGPGHHLRTLHLPAAPESICGLRGARRRRKLSSSSQN